MNESKVQKKAIEFEGQLLKLYQSPLLSSENLQKALGYRSIYALRQAITRKTVPVRVFKLPNRRNYYALVKDVALWLAIKAIESEEGN